MHGRLIEGLGSSPDAQESRALLESLGSESRDLKKLFSIAEGSVLLAVRNDVFGHRLADARYIGQKREGSRVKIHADSVDTLFHDAGEGAVQLFLVHVVLILAHADRFGIDLDQFRQRILKSSGNRGRASLSHVKLRKFFRRELTGAVYGRAGLVDDHVLQRLLLLFNEFYDHLLGLPRSGAVADADHGYVIFAYKFLQLLPGLPDLILRRCWIDHFCIEDPPGGVRHCQLAAGAESRIPAQDHLAGDGLLHQKLLEV